MVVGVVLVGGSRVPRLVVDSRNLLKVLFGVWVFFCHPSYHQCSSFEDVYEWVQVIGVWGGGESKVNGLGFVGRGDGVRNGSSEFLDDVVRWWRRFASVEGFW